MELRQMRGGPEVEDEGTKAGHCWIWSTRKDKGCSSRSRSGYPSSSFAMEQEPSMTTRIKNAMVAS